MGDVLVSDDWTCLKTWLLTDQLLRRALCVCWSRRQAAHVISRCYKPSTSNCT